MRIDQVDTSAPPRLRLYVTEIDPRRLVPKLPVPADVHLKVDDAWLEGVEPTIDTFARAGGSVAVVLVIQASRSMDDVSSDVKNGLGDLIQGLSQSSQVGVIAYASTILAEHPPTSPGEALAIVRSLPVSTDTEVQLPAAVSRGLEQLTGAGTAKLPKRRLLVILSDGTTANFNQVELRGLASQALHAQVRIDTVAYAVFPDGPPALSLLSEGSHGMARLARNADEFKDTFKAISEELNAERVLDYTVPQLFDGKRHELQLVISGQATDWVNPDFPLDTSPRPGLVAPVLIALSVCGALTLAALATILVIRRRRALARAVVARTFEPEPATGNMGLERTAMGLRPSPGDARAAFRPAPAPREAHPERAAKRDEPSEAQRRGREDEHGEPRRRGRIERGPRRPPVGAEETSRVRIKKPSCEIEDESPADQVPTRLPEAPSRREPEVEPPTLLGTSIAANVAASSGSLLPSPTEFLRLHEAGAAVDEATVTMEAPPHARPTPPPASIAAPHPAPRGTRRSISTLGEAALGWNPIASEAGSASDTTPPTGDDPLPGIQPAISDATQPVPAASAVEALGPVGLPPARGTVVMSPRDLGAPDRSAWLVRLARDCAAVPLGSNLVISTSGGDLLVDPGPGPSETTLRMSALGVWLRIAENRSTPLADDDVFTVGAERFLFKLATRVPTARAETRPCLEVVGGLDAGMRIPLDEGRPKLVGSGPGVDALIRGKGVAPRHAAIQRTGDAVEIVDLGSQAGLLVGGLRRLSVTLKAGQDAQLGSVRLLFHLPQEPPLG